MSRTITVLLVSLRLYTFVIIYYGIFGCRTDNFTMTNCDSFLIVSTKMYIVATPVYLNLCIRKGTPCNPSFTIEKWDSREF